MNSYKKKVFVNFSLCLMFGLCTNIGCNSSSKCEEWRPRTNELRKQDAFLDVRVGINLYDKYQGEGDTALAKKHLDEILPRVKNIADSIEKRNLVLDLADKYCELGNVNSMIEALRLIQNSNMRLWLCGMLLPRITSKSHINLQLRNKMIKRLYDEAQKIPLSFCPSPDISFMIATYYLNSGNRKDTVRYLKYARESEQKTEMLKKLASVEGNSDIGISAQNMTSEANESAMNCLAVEKIYETDLKKSLLANDIEESRTQLVKLHDWMKEHSQCFSGRMQSMKLRISEQKDEVAINDSLCMLDYEKKVTKRKLPRRIGQSEQFKEMFKAGNVDDAFIFLTKAKDKDEKALMVSFVERFCSVEERPTQLTNND